MQSLLGSWSFSSSVLLFRFHFYALTTALTCSASPILMTKIACFLEEVDSSSSDPPLRNNRIRIGDSVASKSDLLPLKPHNLHAALSLSQAKRSSTEVLPFPLLASRKDPQDMASEL